MTRGAPIRLAAPPLSLIAAGGLLLVGCGRGPLNSPSQGVGCSVTVQIPAAGSGLLGTVQARVGGTTRRLDLGTTTIPLSCGQQATLTAQATNPTTNPFVSWVVAGQTSVAPSVTVTADGLITASPKFFIPPTPTPTPTPKVRPSPTPTPTSITLDQWLSYDPAARSATLKLVAGYKGVNRGLSYDGYSNGQLAVSVPVGWTVVVDFSNAATINHSAAVVTPTGTTPVFPGASSPDPTVGLNPGGRLTFSFVASAVGSFRIACLVPGHEGLGMWASFTVTAGGVPTIHL